MSLIEPIRVEYPTALAGQIGDMIQAWHSFCKLPIKTKESFNFVEGPAHGDAGYEMREKPGEDPKETFMLTIEQLPRFLRILGNRMDAGENLEPGLLGFFEDFATLEEQLWPFLGEYVLEASRLFNLPNEWLMKTLGNRRKWTYRLLHYFPDGENKIIAGQHIDKGTMTPHLGESCDGLEYFGEDRVWRPMEMDHDSTLILPGAQLQYSSGGRVKAVCHRVVQTNESWRNGRYSFVCFVDAQNTPIFNKERVGRTQDFPAGFNYWMSDPEFSSMFKNVS